MERINSFFLQNFNKFFKFLKMGKKRPSRNQKLMSAIFNIGKKFNAFGVLGKLEGATDPRLNPIFMPERKEKELTVITLGTGIPVPNILRAGTANAIIYKNNCIIVDCARWATRQIIRAKISFNQINGLIFTHLHQDHINAWPTLWMDALFCGRETPWQIWGPVGTKKCIDAIKTFNDRDIKDRIIADLPIHGLETNVIELKDKDEYTWEIGDIKITGVPVVHSREKDSFGFRFDTPKKSIIISGDTAKSENLIELGKKSPVDVLVHEVCLADVVLFAVKAGIFMGSEKSAKIIGLVHSTISEIIDVANEIRPKKLVLTHIMPSIASPSYIVKAIKEGYDGDVVCANDLDCF